MIKDVVVELLTPIKQNMNVDLKTLRKIVQECNKNQDDLGERQKATQKVLEEMNVSVYRMLKDSNMENTNLDREIKRMQEIDRLKVSHANDVFYNPDTGSMLPSLDTCHAST